MTPDQKNTASHRYRAAIGMRELMLRYDLVREVGQ
jgi:hypothetical protein